MGIIWSYFLHYISSLAAAFCTLCNLKECWFEEAGENCHCNGPQHYQKNSHKTHGSSLLKRWLKIYSPTPGESSTITLNHLQCWNHSVILFAYNCVSCNNLELKPIWCFYLFTCAKALSSVQLYILHVYHNTTTDVRDS